MFTLMLLMSFDPPHSDLERFPGYIQCVKQERLYREHGQRLLIMEGIHGWQDGLWQHHREQNVVGLRYWKLLEQTHFNRWTGQGFVCSQLDHLRSQIGWYHYYQGWHPPLYPEYPPVLIKVEPGKIFLGLFRSK